MKNGHLGLEGRYLYLSHPVSWSRSESRAPVLIEPGIGGRIAVELVVPEGIDRAVKGWIELHFVHASGNRSSRVSRQQVSAANDFAFCAVEPTAGSEGSYEVRFEGRGLVGRSGGLVPEAGRTLPVRLVLHSGVRVAGIVRDSAGLPLKGARVAAHTREPGAPRIVGSMEVVTAENGAFSLEGLAPGEIVLIASQESSTSEAYAPVRMQLGSLLDGAVQRDVELIVGVGGTLAGRVSWSDGSPATSVEVVAIPETEPALDQARENVRAWTGHDGTFALKGLSAASYRIVATPDRPFRGLSALVDGVPVESRDLVLILARGFELSGTVVDLTGAPIPFFRLNATRRGPGTLGPSDERRGAVEDDGGSFRLQGLAPGTWLLLVRSKGFGQSIQEVTLPTEEPLRIVLWPEAIVRGLVVDPTGTPVPNACIEAGRPDSALSGPERTCEALALGRFQIGRLGPGRLSLRASSHQFAPSEPVTLELRAGERVEDLRLELREGGWTLFRVRRRGAPVDVPLWITDSDGTRHPASELGVGDYRFGPAAAGTYTVRARHDGQTLEREFEVVPGAPEPVLELAFE